ncbi:predicted protein [Nematostella vectensis]|uniref:OTU domain-containing protein n=1 Tax=Nematostella vectensis TaxID=45351 RepID=A7SH19_NEMVE|nr:predicted protein [Nematostella vectensis]|eukprot:XP_001629077.1 predicted protein [Nematostella vectensis]
MPWNILVNKLPLFGLLPLDCGGQGSCFFKSCAHQLYGNHEFHNDVRLAGIDHLHRCPELYIESFPGNSWEAYIEEMSIQDTWCDNIIIQAMANAFNCVIHITDSTESSLATLINPFVNYHLQNRTIFLGYINDLHYVSTVPL